MSRAGTGLRDPDRLGEDLVIAFRDGLVADREALRVRIADCRTAIDEEDVVAFGEQETFRYRDELLDPAGNDYSWALGSFGFERVSAQVCEAAFSEASDRG